MKKILVFLTLLCMMALPVSAIPQVPYMIYGHVDWNEQMLSGSKIEIVNTATGAAVTVITDGAGYWVYQLIQYSMGNVISITAGDGCGTLDTCSKSVTVGGPGTEDYAIVDFSLTGDLTCPPVDCPSCGGSGGCGGGGGGGGCIITESKCEELYPCDDKETNCDPLVYSSAKCLELYPSEPLPCPVTCPECSVCDELECLKEDCPEPEGSGLWPIIASILTGLTGLGIGGYFVKRKEAMGKGVGIKIYTKRNGSEGVYHKHPGTVGYHDPNTSHREVKERHPKGELTPKYLKEELTGEWSYVE